MTLQNCHGIVWHEISRYYWNKKIASCKFCQNSNNFPSLKAQETIWIILTKLAWNYSLNLLIMIWLCILINCLAVCLTNRFYVVVHLLSSRLQMTSKCGKNISVAYEPWITDVLATFWCLLWSVTGQMDYSKESICFI